jgi:hypothetical protein
VSEARIRAGFHYRFSTRVGEDMGRKIGEYVVTNFIQPVTVGGALNDGLAGPRPARARRSR